MIRSLSDVLRKIRSNNHTISAMHSISGPQSLPFTWGGLAGFVDTLEGAPLPLLRVIGWFAGNLLPPMTLFTSDSKTIYPLVQSRQRRKDVLAANASSNLFAGYRVDFMLDAGQQPKRLQIGEQSFELAGLPEFSQIDPHYSGLFRQSKVLGRNSIYGSGPPVDGAEEFKEFAAMAAGKILDFGCGNGDLVEYLRNQSLDAEGIELDNGRAKEVMKPGARDHVRFYGGSVPLPYADAAFDSIVSTEVIEHVPGIAEYVPEFARVLRPSGRLLVTTPDITSIPSSFLANCVPWHLLESTHVNFFTPLSVATLFASHFRLLSTYCLGSGRVNGYFVPGSIGAIFERL